MLIRSGVFLDGQPVLFEDKERSVLIVSYVLLVSYQTESELRKSSDSMFSSKKMSVVRETSVSWADWKLVTLRDGMPRHLSTEAGREWGERRGGHIGDLFILISNQ